MTLWEKLVANLCEKFTKEELAECVISNTKSVEFVRKDNDALRAENEMLKRIIAKYEISHEDDLK